MPKKRDFLHENMEESERLFYEKSQFSRESRIKYIDWLKNTSLSPTLEETTKQLFSILGDAEKIPCQRNPTYDYKIDSIKLLIEITSLDLIDYSGSIDRTELTNDFFYSKVQNALEHVSSKDALDYPIYKKSGVIFYNIPFQFYNKFYEWIYQDPQELYQLIPSELDFVLFLHQPASINNKDAWEKYKPIGYSKDISWKQKFTTIFNSQTFIFRVI
jgi:hypothetical protein